MQPIAHPFDFNAQRRRCSRPRWFRLKWLMLMAALLLFFSGCVSLVYYEGDYHGKVIDAETLQPIEGAVVLGVWSKMYGTAGGPVYKYYDARETITDENGEFTIKCVGPRALTHLQKMKIVIFKAGYEDFDRSSWEEMKSDEQTLWEGEKAIVLLKKLSLEQRRKRLIPSIGSYVPMEKQKLFRKEVNREIGEIYK